MDLLVESNVAEVKRLHKKLQGVWSGMKQRCRNPRSKAYHRYGGRGIRVCDRWESFGLFYADMAVTYQEGLQLDRQNNDGPYSPDNCRWVTSQINVWNRILDSTGQSSKYTGVCYNKLQDQWIAGIRIDKHRIHLGTFNTEIEAAAAYDVKCTALRATEAHLNQEVFVPDFEKAPVAPVIRPGKWNLYFTKHIGKTFKHLQVLGVSTRLEGGAMRKIFDCQCSCGTLVTRKAIKVLDGTVVSCGCIKNPVKKIHTVREDGCVIKLLNQPIFKQAA